MIRRNVHLEEATRIIASESTPDGFHQPSQEESFNLTRIQISRAEMRQITFNFDSVPMKSVKTFAFLLLHAAVFQVNARIRLHEITSIMHIV